MPLHKIRTGACRLYPYKVALACLCFLLAGHLQSLFADDSIEKHNRIEKVFSFGEILLADEPLPNKVFERRRYVVQIYMIIHRKGDVNTRYGVFSGSGIAYPTKKPGTIVSSAHVIQQSIFEFTKTVESDVTQSLRKDPSLFNPSSVINIIGMGDEAFRKLTYVELTKKLANLNCEFTVFARAYSNTMFTEMVPLRILAITEPENPVDTVILQIVPLAQIIQKANKSPEPPEFINAYSAFVTPIKVSSVPGKTGEDVYIAGFGALLPFVEKAHVSVRIISGENTPSIYEKLTHPYCLRGVPVPGFSGCPVMNKDGEMIGIVKGGDSKFALVISTDDINEILKKAKLDK